MNTRPCEASVRMVEDVAVIDLLGDIDRNSDPTLTAAYERAVAENASAVLLNFSDVGYINSTGIAVIVGLLARSRTDGKRVTAYGLSPHYREIFEITRLSDFMTIYADEQQAVGGSPTQA